MREGVESLLSYLSGNWPEIVWIIMAAGLASYLGARRERGRWRNRRGRPGDIGSLFPPGMQPSP